MPPLVVTVDENHVTDIGNEYAFLISPVFIVIERNSAHDIDTNEHFRHLRLSITDREEIFPLSPFVGNTPCPAYLVGVNICVNAASLNEDEVSFPPYPV